MILAPLVSAVFYWLGGQKNKLYRWLMGIPIGLMGVFLLHSYIPILCVVTYYVATSAFPYGEGSWLNFLTEGGKFLVSGFFFGLASFPILGYMACLQGLISAIAFLILKSLDDSDMLKNPWVELGRGFFGVILFLFK